MPPRALPNKQTARNTSINNRSGGVGSNGGVVFDLSDVPEFIPPLRNNSKNAFVSVNSSRYRGVCKSVRPTGDRWQAQISHERCNYYLGTFVSEEEAGIAYARAYHKIHVMKIPPVPTSTSCRAEQTSDVVKKETDDIDNTSQINSDNVSTAALNSGTSQHSKPRQSKAASRPHKKKAKKSNAPSQLTRPQPIKSTASFHGFDVLDIETMLDIILEEENRKFVPEPINWDLIAQRVNATCRKKADNKIEPETLQRIWKYLGYGQLFASSSNEINTARACQSSIRDMLLHQSVKFGGDLVPCEVLPSSDEEDFMYLPEHYANVDHRVAVLTRKKAKFDTPEVQQWKEDPPQAASSLARKEDPPQAASSLARKEDPPQAASSLVRKEDPPQAASSLVRNEDPPQAASSLVRKEDPPQEVSS